MNALVSIFVTVGLVVAAVAASATPEASPASVVEASPQSTPLATPVVDVSQIEDAGFLSGATQTVGTDVERYVWPEDSGDFHGFGLSPVSLTVGNHDGAVYLFAEFVNRTEQPILAPFMVFTATLDGASFGDETVFPVQYLVAPGESAFYIGFSVYRGAILYGDWSAFDVNFTPGVEWGNEFSTVDIRLDVAEGKIYNDGDSPKENVVLEGVGRDSTGVFAGMCGWQPVGASIPPGLFVRLPEGVSQTGGPSRSCTGATVPFVEALGTGPVILDQWLAIVPRP